VVGRYEHVTGFADALRTPASLVDLVWPGVLDRLRRTEPRGFSPWDIHKG